LLVLGKTSNSMDSTYELVCYEPGLKKQVIELQTHLWSPSVGLNTAYFEWKYERNPYVDAPLIYLAMHNGRAVGMRGFFGTQWEGGIPTQKSIVLYADDFVIAPEHRNRALSTKIMAAAFEDLAKRRYQYAFSLSAGPMTFLFSLATGWRSVGSMQPMRQRSWQVALRSGRDRLITRLPVRSRGINEIFRQWSQKKRRSLADIDADQVRRSLTGVPWILFEDVPRCADMAQLIERIGGCGRIRHVRDREYFDWRFQNPLSRYRFLFWAKTRLEGYLVLQEYTAYADKEVVNIVDWEATSVAVQAELLQAAMDLTADRRLITWSVSLPRQTKAVLDEAGFKLVRQPQNVAQQRRALLVRPIRDEELDGDWLFTGQPLLDMKSWDLRMLYSMHG
jgi:GNAT superfamily N-acetyltransferase